MGQIVKMPDGAKVRFPDDMPKEEIRALIEEKFPQETAARQPKAGASTGEFAVQGLSGVNEGIALGAGWPVDVLNSAVIAPAMAGINAVAGTDLKPSDKPFLGSESLRDMMGGAIKPESERPELQVTRRIGQELGAAAIPVGGMALKAAKPIQMLAREAALTLGSGAGAAAAQQLAPDNIWAELGGQLLGAVGVGAVGKGVRKAITPFSSSPGRKAAVDTLKKEGVELTAGQQTGSKGLQYAESELGGGKIADITEKQAEAFTSAVLKRAGVSAKRATPEVLDDAFKRIGQEFDGLAARNVMPLDRQLGTDLSATITDYRNLVAPSQQAPIVDAILTDIVTMAQQQAGSSGVPGTMYQNLRSRLDRLARAAARDPDLSTVLRDIKGALDDAMERGIAATNPDDLGAWQQVRNDYRNILVVEKAAVGAGENAALGLISPAALRQAVVSTHGRRNYARGKDDFSELAHAGVATMAPLPQSGTAPRLAARSLAAVPAAVGAALGSPAGFPGMVGGAVAGAAIPAITGRAILSPVGRRYLANRVLTGSPSLDPRGIGPASGSALAFNNNLSGDKRNALRLQALN